MVCAPSCIPANKKSCNYFKDAVPKLFILPKEVQTKPGEEYEPNRKKDRISNNA